MLILALMTLALPRLRGRGTCVPIPPGLIEAARVADAVIEAQSRAAGIGGDPCARTIPSRHTPHRLTPRHAGQKLKTPLLAWASIGKRHKCAMQNERIRRCMPCVPLGIMNPCH